MKAKMLIPAAAILAGLAMWGFTPSQPEAHDPGAHPAHLVHGPVVTVSGLGRVSAKPNRASMSIGKVATAPQAAEAIKAVNSTMNELIDQLNRLRLPGAMIQTSSVQVWPEYAPNRGNEQPRITGYRATNSVTVRMDDVNRIGEVFDLATDNGANQISGPTFDLQNTERAERAALRKAVADAKGKAQAIAEEMGMTIVAWEEIREGGTDAPQPMYRMEAMAGRAAGGAGTPVEAGEIETTASVTLVARLAPAPGGAHDGHEGHDEDH